MLAKLLLALLPIVAMGISVKRDTPSAYLIKTVNKPVQGSINDFEQNWADKCVDIASQDPRGNGTTSFFEYGNAAGENKDTQAQVYCVATKENNGITDEYPWTTEVASALGAEIIGN
ncbi:hypothetical protein M231_04303 [Tremella mesenterica]|uniref:Uncharacterized protein n=1 Tax=Tremella mesenterica TaxID=5217 RepID=A0A4Q1BKW0_TREME|nr:uncharacterized protein TREMEDRAFT_59214 [Tremella mesenterica DSM 1558]EIW73051.1 hypothetical protein TREMEDRAFT_59214 [Tremella mesenterica DSM 1558]RXK38394.1 hypothetical protein M231_04303 [Tremella mesenterica]